MAKYKSVKVTDVVEDPTNKLLHKKAVVFAMEDTIEITTQMIDDIDEEDGFTRLFLCPLYSTDKLVDLQMFIEDLDDGVSPALEYDVGLAYSGIGDGQVDRLFGDIISDDCIGTAVIKGQSADLQGYQLMFNNNDPANINKELWEVAGLETNPRGLFYLVISITTPADTAAAGTLSVRALVI